MNRMTMKNTHMHDELNGKSQYYVATYSYTHLQISENFMVVNTIYSYRMYEWMLLTVLPALVASVAGAGKILPCIYIVSVCGS